MCLKIKDVLFPFNLFGKKKQCVTFSTADIPAISKQKTLTIDWAGERLICRYTRIIADNTQHKITDVPEQGVHNGDEFFDISIPYGTVQFVRFGIQNETVYFECTNPERLIVNGEQLI